MQVPCALPNPPSPPAPAPLSGVPRLPRSPRAGPPGARGAGGGPRRAGAGRVRCWGRGGARSAAEHVQRDGRGQWSGTCALPISPVPRASPSTSRIPSAQLALADVLAGAAERVDGIREVEGDARGTGDREVRRHVAQRLLGGDAHDRLARLLRYLERLDAVRLGERKPDARNPQGKPVNGLHCLCVHRLASTSCSALVRSTHSPPLSWTSSFRLIAASSMAVTTPKFWPM